jgi:antitoxin CptB
VITDLELSKLRWRCRRGFLENDLVLTRLLEKRGANFSNEEHQQLLTLIALDDNDLWDIITGRKDDFPTETKEMVQTLRQTLSTH